MSLYPSDQTPEPHLLENDKVKSTYSLLALAVLAYTVIGNACSIFFVSLINLTGFSATDFYIQNEAVVLLLISSLPMYAFGIPLFLFILRGKKPEPRTEKKLCFAELLTLFFISRFLVLVGTFLGNSVLSLVEQLTGVPSRDTVTNVISRLPIWLMMLVVVIIGPIVEEWIFRRSLIDRLSGYGKPFAVLFSALLFGLVHGNFSQFFYTFFLGLIFGYIYAKTGKITYTVILHMVTNFLGSVAVMPIEELSLRFSALAPLLAESQDPLPVLLEFGLGNLFALFSYIIVHYGVAWIGLVLLCMYRKNVKRFATEPSVLPAKEMAKSAFVNVGFILFFIFSVILFLLAY